MIIDFKAAIKNPKIFEKLKYQAVGFPDTTNYEVEDDLVEAGITVYCTAYFGNDNTNYRCVIGYIKPSQYGIYCALMERKLQKAMISGDKDFVEVYNFLNGEE